MKIFGEIPGKLCKNCSKELKKLMSSVNFPINFRITSGKITSILKKILDFWNQLVEVLETFRWNFGKIARKLQRNLGEIKNILNKFRKIMEILLGINEVIRNCCWYYEGSLESFSEIISAKLDKNFESLEKLWKSIGIRETLRTNFLKKNMVWKLQKKNWWKLSEIFAVIFGRT